MQWKRQQLVLTDILWLILLFLCKNSLENANSWFDLGNPDDESSARSARKFYYYKNTKSLCKLMFCDSV